MRTRENSRIQNDRLITSLSIVILVALIHAFRLGSYLKGDLYIFYYSFASDILLPVSFYFLLCINELTIKLLRKWYTKAAIIFLAATLAEILQFFGIYALGITFDPLDILMYLIGVGIAVVIDRIIFRRFIPFWDING